MTGDFTRDTFRPALGYSSVRLQQGRVLTDADWNEQADIARWIARRTGRDVIGPCGFPEDAPGFALVPIAGDLAIGPGRGYVGGVLVESPAPAPVRLERVSGSGANTLYRVAEGPRLKPGQPLPPPDGDLAQSVTVTELALDEDGRQEVRLSASLGAGATELRSAAASIGAQPHLPAGPLPEAPGDYLAYLEVWERPIGALEDPALREVALGGPDTCQRERVIWQVKLLPLAGLVADGAIPAPPSCKSFPAGWRPEGPVEPARLAARAEAASAEADPCALPAAGGYRSLENRLYRVEVHNGGQLGPDKVTLKWSRDNAIHRARLLAVADGALEVDSPGRDEATAYRENDWLEVLDEARILTGRPGFFVRLAEVNGNRLGVAEIRHPDTLEPLIDGGAPDIAKLPGTGQVRRWEGGPPAAAEAGVWTPLENGVEVRPEGGFVRTGDYWTIPARTVTADIEWPLDPGSGAPLSVAPDGIARRYCALAILARAGNGAWSVTDDCRHLFPPLTALESFHYLGGDGQEAMPDPTGNALVSLARPFRVGVARGETPVAGRHVRFRVTEPAAPRGAISSAAGTAAGDVVKETQTELIVRTNAEGIAEAAFALHPKRAVDQVVAELMDATVPDQAERSHLPIRFTANLSLAAETAYDPQSCAFQADEKVTGGGGVSKTVQAALDKLCPPVDFVKLGGDAQLLRGGEESRTPLRVGLFWGAHPLREMAVAFEVTSGSVQLDPAEAKTGPDGIAEVSLKGADPLEDGGWVTIRAKAAEPPTGTQPETLDFHARYLGGIGPAVHAVKIVTAADGDDLAPRRTIAPDALARGLIVTFDDEIDPAVATGAPELPGEVVLHLPFPGPPQAREMWLLGNNFGIQKIKLDGMFSFDDQPGDTMKWRPSATAIDWLTSRFFEVLKHCWVGTDPGEGSIQAVGTCAAELRLFGTRIWSAQDSGKYLDGDLFIVRKDDPVGRARYPSGNGTPGGDLVLPFFVGRDGGGDDVGGGGGGVRDGFIGLVPLRTGPLIADLNTLARRGTFAGALTLSANRSELRQFNVVPQGATVDTGRPHDPQRAQSRVASLGLQATSFEILVHRDHNAFASVLGRQLRIGTGLGVRPRQSDAANRITGIVREVRVNTDSDFVLVDKPMLEALRADPEASQKLMDAPLLDL